MASRSPRRASSGAATATPSMPAAAPRAHARPSAHAAPRPPSARRGSLGVDARLRSSSSAGQRDPSPIAVRVRISLDSGQAARCAGGSRIRTAGARHRASGLADVRGLDGAGAVVAAALAQLGWPYVWGGESRAEGGFDCSGLIDYAFAAAGLPHRATDGSRPAAARAARCRPAPRCGRAISCSPARRRITSASSSRLVSRSRRRTAARRCTSSRCVTATGRAQGASCRPQRPTRVGGDELTVPAYVPGAVPPADRACRARRAAAACAARRPARGREWLRRLRPLVGRARRASRSSCPARGPAPGIRSARSSPFDAAPAIAAQARLMHDLLDRSARRHRHGAGGLQRRAGGVSRGLAARDACLRRPHHAALRWPADARGRRATWSSPLRAPPSPLARWRCDCCLNSSEGSTATSPARTDGDLARGDRRRSTRPGGSRRSTRPPPCWTPRRRPGRRRR